MKIAICLLLFTASLHAEMAAQTAPGRIELAWDASAGADSYRIYRTEGSEFGAPIDTSAATGFIDTSVVGGKTYTYAVTALSGTAESEKSKPLTVTVMVDPCVATPFRPRVTAWPKSAGGATSGKWNPGEELDPVNGVTFGTNIATFRSKRGCVATVRKPS